MQFFCNISTIERVLTSSRHFIFSIIAEQLLLQMLKMQRRDIFIHSVQNKAQKSKMRLRSLH